LEARTFQYFHVRQGQAGNWEFKNGLVGRAVLIFASVLLLLFAAVPPVSASRPSKVWHKGTNHHEHFIYESASAASK
jgi:hypothetical protein